MFGMAYSNTSRQSPFRMGKLPSHKERIESPWRRPFSVNGWQDGIQRFRSC